MNYNSIRKTCHNSSSTNEKEVTQDIIHEHKKTHHSSKNTPEVKTYGKQSASNQSIDDN